MLDAQTNLLRKLSLNVSTLHDNNSVLDLCCDARPLVAMSMFYSEAILSRRGPLARVWLAAHYERKINKSQTLQTDIVESVGMCLVPQLPGNSNRVWNFL